MGVRRLPLVLGGAAAMIAGGALVVASGSRLSNGVEALAPAPAGCETVLEFDDAGTYTFFLETSGSIGALEGDVRRRRGTTPSRGTRRRGSA